jgi:uncharacterized protein with PQ loop repeat
LVRACTGWTPYTFLVLLSLPLSPTRLSFTAARSAPRGTRREVAIVAEHAPSSATIGLARFAPKRRGTMTIHPPECASVGQPRGPVPIDGLERILRLLSVATMLMTIPQVLTIWVGGDVGGISLISWASYLFSACLWFVYGIRKHDKTIYLACVGWIVLDAAVVIGIVVHR